MKDSDYYSINLGGLWVNPTENNFWEPVDQDEVTCFAPIKTARKETECKWVNKLDGGLRLQTSIWWVATIKESELKEGLTYWKVVLCKKPLTGYANTIREAVGIVEALVLTDANYNYKITNEA